MSVLRAIGAAIALAWAIIFGKPPEGTDIGGER